MDDCDLEKLSVKPGTLSPAFKKDVLDYNVTVPSSAEKITFDPRTSDTGASYSISVGTFIIIKLTVFLFFSLFPI